MAALPQRFLAGLLIAFALLLPGAGAAQTFPQLTGQVVDAANIIPPEMEAGLTAKLAGLEQQSQRQLVVVTLPGLQGYDIADYGYQLGRHWGIGDKERNDGALLIVAPNERKVRIEVGYGLEPVLTDGMSSLIINQAIIPRFRQGDMPAGIEAGTDAIIRQLTLPAEEAERLAQQANQTPESSGFDPGLIVFGLFFLFFFVLPLLGSLGGGRRYRKGGMPPVVIWPGSFGGGRGGGGFSGGGFSGGGGSFGGGGASGSW
ncbi:TPM domain-containing protein [Tsuneonella sp. CC-YZS046]|uniref:TPM domain-containing protein n=1 Tax=Tsuneonella sp. CC-YZS046 TaxID=3042152 RepID=UPI003A7F13B0